MVYRPSPLRVVLGGGFALLGLWPAMAGGVPLAFRCAGWVLFGSAVPIAVIAARTSVRVSEDVVEVGGVLGVKRFVRGQATVRRFAVPGGTVRDGSAVHFEASDGGSATVALGLFRPQDRLALIQAVRAVLRG